MVTLAPEFALDVDVMTRLAERGMDCARMNLGANDSAALWQSMIETIRMVERRTGLDVPRPDGLGRAKYPHRGGDYA